MQKHIQWRTGFGLLAAAILGACLASGAAAQTLTYVSDGGQLLTVSRKTLVEPAEKALGITVKSDTNADRYPVVKTQIAAGKVFWDVTDVAMAYCIRGAEENTWEKIDYSVVTNAAELDKKFRNDYFIGFNAYSTVMAFSSEKFGKNGPQTWADFWDVKKFPGKRSLRNYPRPTLEVALLADGVAPDKLYPLDVERAFRKLEEIKPHISVWWTSGGQSTQLLRDGEADLMALWNGRAAAAIEAGAKASFHFNQGIMENTCLAILRGSPNKTMAMRFLNEMLKPESQANFANEFDSGPLNPRAFATGLVKEARLEQLPSSPQNMPKQVVLSAEWWASDAGVKAEERWLGFMQKR